MDRLIIHEPDVGDHIYLTANGFVSRCVSPIHHENRPDARRVAAILNEFFEREPRGLDRIDERLGQRVRIS